MKRAVFIILAVLMLVTTLPGCSSKSGDSGKSSTGVKQLTIWGDSAWIDTDAVNAMVKKFNDNHSDIKLTYQPQNEMTTVFISASMGGKVPDLLIWDRWETATYAPKNVFAPIDNYVTKDNISKKDFFEPAMTELTSGGKLYGLPLDIDNWGLLVNTGLLKQNNLSIPKTWNEFENTAKALTVWKDGKMERSGFSMANLPGGYYSWLQTAGGKMLSDDNKSVAYGTPEGKSVLDFWNKLLNEDKVYANGFDAGLSGSMDSFVTGKVAMTMGPALYIKRYEKYKDQLDFEFTSLPAGPKGDKGGLIGGYGLVIPAASKNQDAAWNVIKWWTAEPANALEWGKLNGYVPGNTTVYNDSFFQNDKNLKNLIESLKTSKIRPAIPGYTSLETQCVIPKIQAMFQGLLTTDKAMEKMTEQGNQFLNSNK